jgi:hypothetical protein
LPGTPDLALMPEHSALLAVDVIGSGDSRPEHLHSIPELVGDLTQAALRAAGLSRAAQDDQFTGDGFLRTYPARFLPAVVDMISVLDELLAAHNQRAKPEIRLRVAVHLGPVPPERGFHRPNIDVSRLLDAAEFKHVVRHCREHITTDTFTTALILSESAYQTLFQGDYTRVITRNEFAPLPITNKEFHEQAWVRIPGVHPTQISGIPLTAPAPPSREESAPRNPSGERSISNSGAVQGNQVTGDGNTISTTPPLNVSNHASGGNTVIQAGILNGNVNQNEQRKYVVDANHAEGMQIGDGNTQNHGRAYRSLGDQHITER